MVALTGVRQIDDSSRQNSFSHTIHDCHSSDTLQTQHNTTQPHLTSLWPVRGASFTDHPIDELLNKFPDYAKMVLPRAAPSVRDCPGGAGDQRTLEADREAWTRDGGINAWQPTVLCDLAMVIRRSPPTTDFTNRGGDGARCGRCLRNVVELADAVANTATRPTLVVYLTGAVPAASQAYLFMVASLVVGMHGGAWGQAIMMTPGQV